MHSLCLTPNHAVPSSFCSLVLYRVLCLGLVLAFFPPEGTEKETSVSASVVVLWCYCCQSTQRKRGDDRRLEVDRGVWMMSSVLRGHDLALQYVALEARSGVCPTHDYIAVVSCSCCENRQVDRHFVHTWYFLLSPRNESRQVGRLCCG